MNFFKITKTIKINSRKSLLKLQIKLISKFTKLKTNIGLNSNYCF